ncbi:CheY-like superfamily, partial [Leptodontidium sp. MPI-SDFR-AT-0119]
IRKIAKEGRPYHMVLMDIQMPVLDGYKLRNYCERFVIVLTASAIEGDQKKCLASGINDYLAKPVRLALLKENLETIC